MILVGAGTGIPPVVRVFGQDGNDLSTITAFDPSITGGVRTASADFNADGVPDWVVGTGPGSSTLVRIIDGSTQTELFAVAPFESSFGGGVYVATGDLTGDGIPDLVITPDEGGGPRVRVFSGQGFSPVADFFGIDDPNFRGGARATLGDFDADGVDDLVVAAGFGGGPRIAIFNGLTIPSGLPVRMISDFFVFEDTLRNGAYVAAGDVNGDGFAELIAGGGPGGGPRVTILSGQDLLTGLNAVVANFFAGDETDRGGVRVVAKNLDNDLRLDVITGSGAGSGSRVTAYSGTSLTSGYPLSIFSLDAFPGFTGGIFVG